MGHAHPAASTLLHHHALLQVRRHTLHAPAATHASSSSTHAG
jgi:hypothetical protein